LRLTSAKTTYAAGEPVPLTLTVTNASRSLVTLQFSSGQQYDFEVQHEGKIIWRWSADRMFTQALTSFTLGPKENKTFAVTWKQQDNEGKPVSGGGYEAVGTLTTMQQPRLRSQRLKLRIGG